MIINNQLNQENMSNIKEVKKKLLCLNEQLLAELEKKICISFISYFIGKLKLSSENLETYKIIIENDPMLNAEVIFPTKEKIVRAVRQAQQNTAHMSRSQGAVYRNVTQLKDMGLIIKIPLRKNGKKTWNKQQFKVITNYEAFFDYAIEFHKSGISTNKELLMTFLSSYLYTSEMKCFSDTYKKNLYKNIINLNIDELCECNRNLLKMLGFDYLGLTTSIFLDIKISMKNKEDAKMKKEKNKQCRPFSGRHCPIAPPGKGEQVDLNKDVKLYQNAQECLKEPKSNHNSMVKIHPEGYIDSRNFEKALEKYLEKFRKDQNILPENKELIERFVYDAKIGKTILQGQKKKVGNKRIIKYFQDLKKLDAYFRKPFSDVLQVDMERFIFDLEEGKLKHTKWLWKEENEQRIKYSQEVPYSKETQVSIKKIIKKFYKWLLGKNREFPEIVNWIDTSLTIPEYKAINKSQVETIIARMTSNTSDNLIRNRALLMVLFDSGARADEFLNLRLKHLNLENGNYKIRIEFSKTKKRTLSLPFCKEYIDAWLDVHQARNEPLAQLFPMNYDTLRKLIERLGNVINTHLTPHSLRHSSATYWAKSLSQYQLCYRFGWAMSSKQPARYIDREGLDQEKTIEIAEVSSINQLSKENQDLNTRLAMLEEKLSIYEELDKKELIEVIKKFIAIKNSIKKEV